MRENKTRIDYAVAGVVLLMEVGEITLRQALNKIEDLLDDHLFCTRNKKDYYYEKAITELRRKRIRIEAHSA